MENRRSELTSFEAIAVVGLVLAALVITTAAPPSNGAATVVTETFIDAAVSLHAAAAEVSSEEGKVADRLNTTHLDDDVVVVRMEIERVIEESHVLVLRASGARQPNRRRDRACRSAAQPGRP